MKPTIAGREAVNTDTTLVNGHRMFDVIHASSATVRSVSKNFSERTVVFAAGHAVRLRGVAPPAAGGNRSKDAMQTHIAGGDINGKRWPGSASRPTRKGFQPCVWD
jgi:hypothetical protein